MLSMPNIASKDNTFPRFPKKVFRISSTHEDPSQEYNPPKLQSMQLLSIPVRVPSLDCGCYSEYGTQTFILPAVRLSQA